MSEAMNALKDRQRATWTAGDFAEVAKRLAPASAAMVDELGVRSGQDLLDVACGTGNASIPAARRGARVTGLDLTPKLVEIARERARAEGLEIEFVEGDAEDLPFDDDSFDRVISIFGAMFAPDQQRAADELVRVCRPGGRLGFSAWTPEGLNGRMLTMLGAHLPPPPEGFQPPVLWGVPQRVRELLAPHGLEPSFARREVEFEAESVEAFLAFNEAALGPVILARAALEPDGRWQAARADLAGLYEEANEASDGSMLVRPEYLMTTVDLPAP